MKFFNREFPNQQVVIGVIISLILLGGVFAWQKGWLKDIQRQEIQQENETASWEIYKSLKYGYEIKYPNNWQIEDLSSVYDEASSIKSDVRFYPPQVTLYDKSAKDPFIEVEVLDNSKGNSIPVTFRFTWPTSCKDVEVGDLRFCQFNMYAEDSFSDITVYALSKDNLIYIVAIKCDLPKCTSTSEFNVFEQMLSTFRFVDEIADWQTYRDEEWGIEFKYPPAEMFIGAPIVEQRSFTYYYDETYKTFDEYEGIYIGELRLGCSIVLHKGVNPFERNKYVISFLVKSNSIKGNGEVIYAGVTLASSAAGHSFEECKEIFDQILSTFRFIE